MLESFGLKPYPISFNGAVVEFIGPAIGTTLSRTRESVKVKSKSPEKSYPFIEKSTFAALPRLLSHFGIRQFRMGYALSVSIELNSHSVMLVKLFAVYFAVMRIFV